MAAVEPDGFGTVLTGNKPGPSPEQEKLATMKMDDGAGERLRQEQDAAPSVLRQTESERMDLALLRNQLGNPYSFRHIPFSVLRDMSTDLMLHFGYFFTITPQIRADWYVECPSAKIAAAVDAAFRPIATTTTVRLAQSKWYGYQPAVKRFKLGQLEATYRDPTSSEPDEDRPVWDSSADMLLWKPPAALNPSHCLPAWNDDGDMDGFRYSLVPIPHADLGVGLYGYSGFPGGQYVGPEFAMWRTNEKEESWGSVFGSAKTKRAYPFWWSYWLRWALADRSFENLADPAKIVYYPTEFDEFVDPEDPSATNPVVQKKREQALQLGQQTRSGATLAIPGDFATTSDGKATNMRKWQLSYFEGKNNFTELDATFAHLDILKLRAWCLPEQALLEGRGGTSSRLVAAQMGEIYQESQQLDADLDDAFVSENMFQQFIAANFPEQAGIPCRKVTRGLGAIDSQLRSQVLTLVGQVRGDVLPVDTRELLRQLNIPLLSEEGFATQIKQIAELQASKGPPQVEPTKVGTQGYNAGVERTPDGNFSYVQAPERIVLAESDGFMGSLPDTPHYRDAATRSAILRLRKMFMARYERQYGSFADFLSDQATLHLAEATQPTQPAQASKQDGLGADAATAAATAIVSAWAATEAAGIAGAPAQATAVVGSDASSLAGLVSKIALAGGRSTLKSARLDAEGFDQNVIEPWVQERAAFALNSIDNTVRDEAQTFLADALQRSVDPAKVSQEARDHFASFPTTHSERVVRAEAREAYNRGTLEALHLAGVSQVQAHDASEGHDELTDSACLERNGKIYGVQEAMAEQDHPNGTLWWQPLSTEKLSIQRVDQLPEHLAENGQVAYDRDTETLYMLSEVSEEREKVYTLILGDQLSL